MSDFISVTEAADRLGVHPSRVRALVAHGQIEAVPLGNVWAVSARSVSQRAKQPPDRGRPYSPSNAWALLYLADGKNPDWVSPQTKSRLKRTLRLEGFARLSGRLIQRAKRLEFHAHPGEMKYMHEDVDLVLGGASMAAKLNLDLVTGQEVEGYIRERAFKRFRDEHGLDEVNPGQRGNVLLRVVADDAWRLDSGAPLSAIALDLLEAPDKRSQSAGNDLLARVETNI